MPGASMCGIEKRCSQDKMCIRDRSYTKEFAVGSPQCGFDDCMRPSALFECLQDVATLDSERSSFSREHMMEKMCIRDRGTISSV